jgi:hypothetical protein
VRGGGPGAARRRRIVWCGAVLGTLLVAACFWVALATQPPSTAWVLVEPHWTPERGTARLLPDGDPLPGEWFVFVEPFNSTPFHLHRDESKRGAVQRWIDRLLNRGRARGWSCAPCRETGRKSRTEAGEWLEIEPMQPPD